MGPCSHLQQLLSKHEYNRTQQVFKEDLAIHAHVSTRGVVWFMQQASFDSWLAYTTTTSSFNKF